MKRVAPAVLALIAFSTAIAQPTTHPAVEPSAPKETEGYAGSAQPGEMHRKLDAFVGEWDVAMIVPGPGGKDIVLKGTCTKSWVMNGHFIKEELRLPNMMGKMGNSVGYLGYDISGGKYQGVYMSDDMTGMITYSGTVSDDGKTFTFKGTESNPAAKGPALDFKIITTIDSADQHTMSLAYFLPGGQQIPGFKLVHIRKK